MEGGVHMGETTLPWSVIHYSEKEPSRLPGVLDGTP